MRRPWVLAAVVVAALVAVPALRGPSDDPDGVSVAGDTATSRDVPLPDPDAPLPATTLLEPGIEERWVRVDGRRLRALCHPGAPEALLLHDGGASADAWLPVLRLLEGDVRACALDRTGSGESDPAPPSRGWFELEDELRAAGAALDLAAGPTLVGAGLGGLYARLWASGRRREVGGLVLIEPHHEEMLERARRGMPAEAWTARRDAMRRPNEDGIREADLAERSARARLGDIPVTVVTATVRRSGGGWNPRWINEAANELHGSLVASVPAGRHVPAVGSGPDVVRDDPALVAGEIRRVVGLARPGARHDGS